MLDGYALALNFIMTNPMAIVFTLAGLLVGIIIAALPGITGPATIAILIPLTLGMHPTNAIVILASLYIGSTFGGAITAILFNTPGSPEAACTALDGYPIAKNGQPGRALGVAIGVSSLSCALAVVVLAVVAPPLARVALEFGPGEYFAMAFFGLSVIASIDSKSYYKSLTAGMIGLLLATVGFDPLSSAIRNTFGVRPLITGFNFMPVIIGVFAIGEVLSRSAHKTLGIVQIGDMKGISIDMPSVKDWLQLKVTFVRSFFIGVLIGILPGVGATTAAFVSYSEEVRWSKNPKLYGTGIINGVAAPETANSAAAACSMIPMLSLGLPGSAATAVMIGGLIIHGIQPGPLMMVTQTQMVYTIFVTMFIASITMLFFGIFTTRFFALVLKTKYTILAPIISVFCVVGVFSINNSIFEVTLVFFIGIIGYFFKKYEYPLAPLIIGLVLGRIAEENLRRGLSIFNMDVVQMFVMRPITAVLMVLSILSLAYGFYGNLKKSREAARKEKAE